MSKVTIEFNLPEEQEEFNTAIQASKMSAAFWSIGNDVFRPARKHGYPDQRLHDLIHFLDQAAAALGVSEEGWPRDEYGPLNATDLIRMLEEKYHEILRENGVEL
jgi:hypothetical protein